MKKFDERNVHEFIKTLVQEEKSEATLEKYERDIRKFVQYTSGQWITKELVMEYKKELVSHYAPVSVNSMLIPVNRFLKYYGCHDCVVRTLKIQRAVFRPSDRELSREEYLRLVETATSMGDERTAMILQTIASTGIRVSELSFVTMEALKTRVAQVSLKGKLREVLIPKELVRKLRQYARKRNIRTGSIFITRNGKPIHRGNILKSMKRLCAQAHVERKKVFPHNFRHLFACQYYKATGDIVRLADILGHSSIDTTRIYTAVSVEEQNRQLNRMGLVV